MKDILNRVKQILLFLAVLTLSAGFSACSSESLGRNPEPDGLDTTNVNPDTTANGDDFKLIAGGETVGSILAVNTECVARVIGQSANGENIPNPNSSLMRFGIGSTDYGNMWDAGNGTVWSVFGDNFNATGGDWKSNAIAISSDRNLADGLYYDSVLRDAGGARKEIIDPADGEVTCIPTGGFSVQTATGYRQYMSFMDVRQWATDGNDNWSANYSELVYTDDYGDTWTRSGVRWDGNSNFVQTAFVVMGETVYMYGTKAGRYGKAYLAKVQAGDVLNKTAYLYWNGSSWTPDESAATPVTNGTVSEMTVRYNTYYNRYIMMYLSVNQRKLVYRDASAPEGEWSCEKIILNGTYGPSIHPWFCDGRDIWFVSSSVTTSSASYDTWHIFLYHSKLKADPEGFNMIWEGGFEDEPTMNITYKTLWNAANSTSCHDAHTGDVSCKLSNGTEGEWKDACTQSITVKKRKEYILTAWAKSSIAGSDRSYLGVRLHDGTIIDAHPALNSDNWTKITVEFNSGDNTSLDVFFGTWGASGLQVLVDDFSLEPK